MKFLSWTQSVINITIAVVVAVDCWAIRGLLHDNQHNLREISWLQSEIINPASSVQTMSFDRLQKLNYSGENQIHFVHHPMDDGSLLLIIRTFEGKTVTNKRLILVPDPPRRLHKSARWNHEVFLRTTVRVRRGLNDNVFAAPFST